MGTVHIEANGWLLYVLLTFFAIGILIIAEYCCDYARSDERRNKILYETPVIDKDSDLFILRDATK